MPATKQQIRQIIADNNLNSVADIYRPAQGQLQGYPAGAYGGRILFYPSLSFCGKSGNRIRR